MKLVYQNIIATFTRTRSLCCRDGMRGLGQIEELALLQNGQLVLLQM